MAMLTDFENLFKVMIKSSTTSKKRLVIEILTTREAFEATEIENIG